MLDGSVALAWCFDDEATEDAEALLDRVRTDGAAVPRIWHLEVSNGLLIGERRARLQPSKTAAFVRLFLSLPISVDNETDHRAFADTIYIARANKLTAYDAAYLELALRRALPLATLDRDLARAAQRNGVPLLLQI